MTTQDIFDAPQTKRPPTLPSGITVIDNETGTLSFEVMNPGLLLAEAKRLNTLAVDTALIIDSHEMYVEGTDILQKVVGAKKSWDETRLAQGKPLRDKLAEVNSGFNAPLDLMEAAEKTLKGALTHWVNKVEQERQRLQREADAAAERLRQQEREAAAARQREADAEAARLRRVAQEEAAERQRIADAEAARLRQKAQDEAAERQRVADEAAAETRRAAEEAAQAGNAARALELEQQAARTRQEAANDSRQLLESAGQSAAAVVETASGQAQDLLQTAALEAEDVVRAGEADAEASLAVASMVTSNAVTIAAPRVRGVNTRTKYTAVVTDKQAALQFVMDNYALLSHLVEFDQGALNRLAQDRKETFSHPGIVAKPETVMASRRAA